MAKHLKSKAVERARRGNGGRTVISHTDQDLGEPWKKKTLTSIFQSRPSHHFIFLAAMTSTPSPRTSCTLSTLPTEIVEAVAFSLECNDLLLLRLVCRQLWQKTLHPFGKLFETLRTDLSSASLQKLESVSKITPIRQNVQTLLLAKGNNCQFGQDFR